MRAIRLNSPNREPVLVEIPAPVPVEVERISPEQTVEAYRRLKRGEIRGRAVAVPARV